MKKTLTLLSVLITGISFASAAETVEGCDINGKTRQGQPCVTTSTNDVAVNPDGVFDAMTVEKVAVNPIPLLEKILNQETPDERYLGLANFVKTHGEWLALQNGEQQFRLHISSYLLQQGFEQEASDLLKSGDMKGWISYKFQDGVANDFMFALDTGRFQYIQALIDYAPNGVNSTFPVTLTGDSLTPLGLLATDKYQKHPQYEAVIRSLLKNGANPYHQLPNGLSPVVIAASSNNHLFTRIVHAYDSEQKGAASDLLRNTPLTDAEMIEMQTIADALIERKTQGNDNYSFSKLHELWIQMILKGYNTPADLIYDRLLGFKEFKVDDRLNDGGLNGLMATALSSIYGGNVEYASRLIERGANPSFLIEVAGENEQEATRINLIQLALQNDNHKVVTLLIQKGVNFVLLPDDEEALILSEAMEQRAFKSAFVIKEALNASLEKLEQ